MYLEDLESQTQEKKCLNEARQCEAVLHCGCILSLKLSILVVELVGEAGWKWVEKDSEKTTRMMSFLSSAKVLFQ